MKHRILKGTTALLIAAGTVGMAAAQSLEDSFRYSQNNYSNATARSSAMGGAFVSLGSDASSMSINPAGLGMYRASEISITPALNFTSTSSSYEGMSPTKANSSHFFVGNFAGIFNGRNFTAGIGYNRLANFRGRSYSTGAPTEVSMGDMFAAQLQGIPSSQIGRPSGDEYRAFYTHESNLWPAILAYQSYLIDPVNPKGDNIYHMSPSLFAGDRVTPVQEISTRGAVDEVTLSGAYNYNDFLYFGITLGIQSIHYSEARTYGEYADYSNTGMLDEFAYRQAYALSGSGANVKVGVTVRPVDWLRIGVAYHSPTWSNLATGLDQDLTVRRFNEANAVTADAPTLVNDYSMNTPNRLLVGLSTVIAKRVILSADYEAVWYNGIRYTSRTMRPLNPLIEQVLGPANNFRAGIEVAATRSFFVRAGFAYYGSVYRDREWKKFDQLTQYSAGIGYRSRNFSVDLAYIYGRTNKPEYRYYDDLNIRSGLISSTVTTSNVLLTLAARF